MMNQSVRPSSKVQLSLNCSDLTSLDSMSKSDPMILVQMRTGPGGLDWTEIARTERIKNTKDPKFNKKIELEYFFEEQQAIRFWVLDIDTDDDLGSKKWSAADHDSIGLVDTTLGTIVGASSGNFHADIVHGQKCHGKLNVVAEELSAGAKGMLSMQFRGEGLDKKDWFGSSDPFVEFYRQSPSGSEIKVCATEVIMNTLDPSWRTLSVSVAAFCNGDPAAPIAIRVYDWDADGSHDLIGHSTTTLGELQSSQNNASWDLINPKKVPGGKKAKKGYKNSGVLHMTSFALEQDHTFIDYLVGGCEISFSVAVDFTGSNGNPQLPTSLHYMNPHAPNQYASAINTVGGIIQDYDLDKQFPAYGYGAKLPTGEVSHCFALNGNEANPFCGGIQGVVGAYYQAIGTLELWGPTNFAPVIKHAAEIAAGAEAGHKGKVYFVLLILTDGAITDMQQTKDQIVAASHLPMSIIIIGIGNADFVSMEQLDGDGGPLKDSRGTKSDRDIVQFVPFAQYASNPAMLAKEVLAEVPLQLTSYMKKHQIAPGVHA